MWRCEIAEGKSLESTSGLVASLILFPSYSEEFRRKFIRFFDQEYKKCPSDMVRSLTYTLAHFQPRTDD
jgi:hypothetical protein